MDSRNSLKTGAWGIASLKPPYKKKLVLVRLHDLCDIRSIRFSGFACAATGCGAGMNYTRTRPLGQGMSRGFTKGTQIPPIAARGEDKWPAKPNRPKAEGGRAEPGAPGAGGLPGQPGWPKAGGG